MTLLIHTQKQKKIVNESDINDVSDSIYTNTSNKQKPLEKGSRWITNSVIDHNFSISKYNYQKN